MGSGATTHSRISATREKRSVRPHARNPREDENSNHRRLRCNTTVRNDAVDCDIASRAKLASTMASIPVNTSTVCAVVLSKQGGDTKMLLLKRTKGDYWCHIGGKVEADESAWQAALREIREETAAAVKAFYAADYIEQFYQIEANAITLVPAFVAWVAESTPITLNHEHSAYRWCTLAEAKALVPFANQQALYEHVWARFVDSEPSDLLRIMPN